MAGRFLLEIHPQLREDGAPDSVLPVFAEWGEFETDADRLRKDPTSVRVVFFTGGSDVSPALYGERRGRWTVDVDAARDEREVELFRLARAANIPLVGVCRGAQFLCVMAGGKLCQHIDGHGLEREVTHRILALDVDGQLHELACSSTHHQMMLPPTGAEILAWAEPPRAEGRHFDGNDNQLSLEREIEAAYFPALRAFGVQWHPEWMSPSHPCVGYTRRIAAARLGL